MKPTEEKQLEGGMKRCPSCAELVKKEAVVCKHCSAKLQKGPTGPLASEGRNPYEASKVESSKDYRVDLEGSKYVAPKKPNAKKKVLFAITGAVVFILLILIVIVFGVQRDKRPVLIFVDNNNGTISDRVTGLMWAAKDNGSDINWASAKSYCEDYRGGGYSDWRMPTQDELVWLYARDAHKDKIKTTGWVWASETDGSKAAVFSFFIGQRNWYLQSDGFNLRALPVRSGK